MYKEKTSFVLPSTRYQGSKRKMIPWLYEVTKGIKFETVLDAFGGSGIVSYLFKKMGKIVTYNDKLRFNYFIGKALIENQKVLLNTKDVKKLIDQKCKSDFRIIQVLFENIYYLEHENKWLDNTVLNIMEMNHYPENILEYKKAIAYYALFQACLSKRPFNLFHRRNLYIRTNEVKRSFGNKTTWDTSFQVHFKKFVNELNSSIFDSGKKCLATNSCVFEINSENHDLVYFDPPYLSKNGYKETSNYLKCYHFLEGLANYSDWVQLINFSTENLNMKNTESYFKEPQIFENYEFLFS